MSNRKMPHPGGAMGAGREQQKKIIHMKKSVVAVKSILYPNGTYNVQGGPTS